MTDTEKFQFEMMGWFLLQGNWRLVSNLLWIVASQDLSSWSTIFFYFLVLFCSLYLPACRMRHFSTGGLCLHLHLAWWNLLQKFEDLKKNLQIAAMDSSLLKKYNLMCSFSDCKICNAHPFLIFFYSHFGNTQCFKMYSFLWWGRF